MIADKQQADFLVVWIYVGVELKNRQQLNDFFAAQEQNAFRVARYSVGNDDDALYLVQDAMLRLASKYAEKSSDQWRPLFYKVLYSRLTDFHRRKNFRSGIMRVFGIDQETAQHAIASVASVSPGPVGELRFSDSLQALELALERLPLRQQQAVLMRSWHGFSTQETADIMQLSSGSVKTHYSRGLKKLREILGGDWP